MRGRTAAVTGALRDEALSACQAADAQLDNVETLLAQHKCRQPSPDSSLVETYRGALQALEQSYSLLQGTMMCDKELLAGSIECDDEPQGVKDELAQAVEAVDYNLKKMDRTKQRLVGAIESLQSVVNQSHTDGCDCNSAGGDGMSGSGQGSRAVTEA